METAVSTSSQDKPADASTERDSCLADDAQDGLGALSTASQVKGEHSEQSHHSVLLPLGEGVFTRPSHQAMDQSGFSA